MIPAFLRQSFARLWRCPPYVQTDAFSFHHRAHELDPKGAGASAAGLWRARFLIEELGRGLKARA